MITLELVGTTEERHTLLGLKRFMSFLRNVRIVVTLDDTFEDTVHLRLDGPPRVEPDGFTLGSLRPAA